MHTSLLSQIAKKLARHQSRGRVTRLMHPRRDWLIGLTVALCILIGCSVFSAYTYVLYRFNEVTFTTGEAPAVSVYKAAVVASGLDYFTERAANFAALSNSKTVPTIAPIDEVDITQPVATSTESVIEVDQSTALQPLDNGVEAVSLVE